MDSRGRSILGVGSDTAIGPQGDSVQPPNARLAARSSDVRDLGVRLFLSLRSLSDEFADAAISIIFSAGEASVKHSIVAEAELTDAGSA